MLLEDGVVLRHNSTIVADHTSGLNATLVRTGPTREVYPSHAQALRFLRRSHSLVPFAAQAADPPAPPTEPATQGSGPASTVQLVRQVYLGGFNLGEYRHQVEFFGRLLFGGVAAEDGRRRQLVL